MDSLLSLSVHLEPDTANRQALVDSILQRLKVDASGDATWEGETYHLVRNNSRVKTELLSKFGSSVSLEQLDSNIESLIRDSHGWLQSRIDDTFVLNSAEHSADLAMVAKLAASSLSNDIVGQFSALLSGLNDILSSESFFGKTSRVAANLFHTRGSELLLVHARLDSEVSKTKHRVIIFGRKKRSIRINVAIRKVGISREYADRVKKDEWNGA